jgi:hypothetical protein
MQLIAFCGMYGSLHLSTSPLLSCEHTVKTKLSTSQATASLLLLRLIFVFRPCFFGLRAVSIFTRRPQYIKMRLDETCPTVSGSHLVWKHHVILVNFNFTLLQLHSTREQLLETTTTRLYHSHSTNYLVGDCHLRMAVQSDKKSSKL